MYKKAPWPSACNSHKIAIFKNMDGLVLMQLLKTDSLTVNMNKMAPISIKTGFRIEYLTHFVLFFKTPSCHPGTLSSLNAQITLHQIGQRCSALSETTKFRSHSIILKCVIDECFVLTKELKGESG